MATLATTCIACVRRKCMCLCMRRERGRMIFSRSRTRARDAINVSGLINRHATEKGVVAKGAAADIRQPNVNPFLPLVHVA